MIESVNFRINQGGEDVCIAIAQDFGSGEVLMVAFMNREALELTVEKGSMHYYSTSRKKIWHKGEESGHIQRVREAYIDCDGDALLFKVEQKSAACHNGYYSCFYRRLENDEWTKVGEKIFNPDEVY